MYSIYGELYRAGDRFDGPLEPPDPEFVFCRNCKAWSRCELPGYREVGWCHENEEFSLEGEGCE